MSIYPGKYFHNKTKIYDVYKHEPILKEECFLPSNIQSHAKVKQHSTMKHSITCNQEKQYMKCQKMNRTNHYM